MAGTTTGQPDTQVDASGSFRSSASRAWDLLATPAGAEAWLGARPDLWWHGSLDVPVQGSVVHLGDGATLEVCGEDAGGGLMRLRVLEGHRELVAGSTVQLTVTAEAGRTVVDLHQEDLPDETWREPMQERWRAALDRIGVLLDEG